MKTYCFINRSSVWYDENCILILECWSFRGSSWSGICQISELSFESKFSILSNDLPISEINISTS